eukprot:Plantae.Rhodophyta-Rhodochaete_pulchella.ctg15366.p1 GENE.Plantae.Rhodophyta-Rhodochaete_pulchella.ctg15366~~Plantae.Rhodophyta-Rhodochaete_pulchella.ctg15366.p1  ORF type:complete len:473 (-),score=92.34 Plantae.Rhodophyta-Rhodochaete_pulchella.ctg15366:1053-2420(-)
MEYDLTPALSQYLDRHMVILLLEFVANHPNMKGLYDERDLLQARLDLLSQTNMLDSAMETFQILHDQDAPAEMVERREKVLLVLTTLTDDCSPIIEVLKDEELTTTLKENKTFTQKYLEENHGVTVDVLESLYEYGKFWFDCGNYSDAADYLAAYRTLMNTGSEREFYALWGKLAADILQGEFNGALESLNQLKDAIESQSRSNHFNPLQQLQHRTWLIHWSLFVFFNHPNGRNAIIDLFFQEKYLNTIQTNCPHALRYLAAAVIVNKRRRIVMKDLVRVVQQESYVYHDPITEFVECLYVNFDFEGAQDVLQKCIDTIKHDMFLVNILDDFVENARLTIFETYCKIHNCIDIGMLAEKLNMDQAAAERWIVNLIRNARLDAKIDSQANQVLMGVNVPTVYEQIVESTKSLIIRTSVIAQNHDRRDSHSTYGAGDGGQHRGTTKSWRSATTASKA